MTALIYHSLQMDACIELYWDIQRRLTTAVYQNWHESRRRKIVEGGKQLSYRYPQGIRDEAFIKWKEQVNDELGKRESKRNPNRPVGTLQARGLIHDPDSKQGKRAPLGLTRVSDKRVREPDGAHDAGAPDSRLG